MIVILLHVDGCPSLQVAQDRLVRALDLLGRGDVTVEQHRVTSDEEAQRIGFRGSPTIVVDGVDLFPGAPDGPFGLSCRLYPTEDGLAGSPTLDQLVRALAPSPTGT